MDTTLEYILQCERATETQEDWKKQWGDYVARRFGSDYRIEIVQHQGANLFITFGAASYTWHQYNNAIKKVEFIFLPRQDQLQEMVNEDAIAMHQRMTEFILRYAYVPLGKVQPTYEQLWLAFVMREKYQKQWDSERKEWVTIPWRGSSVVSLWEC